jgi:hypothetical protein
MTIPPPGQPVPPPYGPPPKKSKTTLYVVLGIVGAFLLLCAGCGAALVGGTAEVTKSADKAAASPSSKATGKPATGVGLGRPARDGNFQFTVERVRCGLTKVGTSSYLSKRAQGQFCVVTLTVKNVKTDPQTLNDFDQKAFVGGASYEADSAAAVYVNGAESGLWLTNINPGNAVTGQLVFDIPRGATLTKLELHDSAFSGGVEVDL